LYAYAGGNPVGNKDPLGLCKVTLEFSRVILEYYHITAYTSDSNGNNFFVGGPTHNPIAAKDPNPQAQDYGNPDPWGRLRGTYGKVNSVPTGPNTMVVIDDGKPCSCYNKSFENTIDWINASDIPYDPGYQNSNSLVNTILTNAGAPVPQTWSYQTPAYNNNLNNYVPNALYQVK
jgi:hypothetical protein